MPLPLKMTFDAEPFKAAMARIQKTTGFLLVDIMCDQMALWSLDLIRYTPPMKAMNERDPASGQALRVGQTAVRRDIMKIFRSLDDIDDQAWKLKLGSSDQFALVHAEVGKGSGRTVVYGVEANLYRPGAGSSEMGQHHRGQRDSRGHVRKGRDWRTSGQYKFLDKMHVKGASLAAYIKDKMNHVGRAKAGWMAGMNHFSAKSHSAATMQISGMTLLMDTKGNTYPMTWVRRHGTGEGGFVDRFDAVSITGDWAVENRVPYVGGTVVNRSVALLQRKRIKDLAFFYEKRMAKFIKAENGRKPEAA